MQSPLGTPAKLALGCTVLFGIVYLTIGVMWLIEPGLIAGLLETSLLEGTGLATQLGDSAALFLCAGGFMLFGVLRRRPGFLMAGAWLIGLVAPVRVLAWQVHGAALTLQPIIVEVLTFVVVFAAARSLRAHLMQSPAA